jgi:predicted outer membrane repeat protein
MTRNFNFYIQLIQISNCSFSNNHATKAGGALFFQGYNIQTENLGNVFKSNKAKFGKDIYSYPTGLKINALFLPNGSAISYSYNYSASEIMINASNYTQPSCSELPYFNVNFIANDGEDVLYTEELQLSES